MDNREILENIRNMDAEVESLSRVILKELTKAEIQKLILKLAGEGKSPCRNIKARFLAAQDRPAGLLHRRSYRHSDSTEDPLL